MGLLGRGNPIDPAGLASRPGLACGSDEDLHAQIVHLLVDDHRAGGGRMRPPMLCEGFRIR